MRIKTNLIQQKKNPYQFSITSIFIVFLVFCSTLPGQMEYFNHPELVWKSIETEHFLVHYHQGAERTANLVAKIAEEVYPHITGLYQQWPKTKTEFIIRDTDDYSNGGAYFYENKIEIWAQNMDYILRGTHNWLRDVISHEFAHIISMQKAFKFGPNVPAGWLQVFGYETERRPDVVRGFPDVLISYPIAGVTIPVWFAEGVAQFHSPSKRYDYRDSHREMLLRDRVVNQRLLDLKEMGVFGKNSIGNESAYNQGFALVNFLAATFGDSIVSDLSQATAAPLTIDFNSAMKKVTGISADSSYQLWKTYLTQTYSERLRTIHENITEGKPLEDKGIGNIHPVFSPDGEKVAYVESLSDYLSLNALVVMDIQSGEKKVLEGPVASSLSWSPNGRYLAYAKQTELQPNGSSYLDLYVYDLKRYKSYRITRGMRATNPDWSHDGQKLVFVVHSDGLTNLFTLTLDEFVWINKESLWQTYYYDFHRHELVEKIPAEKQKSWRQFYRKVEVWGQGVQQLTHFTDGRQIFHPRWALDDRSIIFDTSINFCRDIARIPATGGEWEFILNAAYDERYPTLDPRSGEIFYASDETGIFNIYSFNPESGEKKPHTNVIGGAFMPGVNRRGDLVFSLYKNQGYKMHWIQKVNHLSPDLLVYDQNYEARIPVITADDRQYQPAPTKPYDRRFGPLGIMPRLLVDYGTIKPGFYVYSNEIIDKMFFLGGADVNLDFEYNLFALTEFRIFKPTVFLEFYNQSAKISDNYYDPDSFTVSRDRINVSFNLMEFDAGLRGRFREHFSWEFSYIFSFYRANIGTYSFFDLADQITYVVPEFRYTYLRGHALSLRLHRHKILPEVDREVNPRKGYYASLRYTREFNKFLDDFNTEGGDINEVYSKYHFNRFFLDVENYLPVPLTKYHSFSVRLQGGYIDKQVDDFFYFFAGGFVGLKGYSYYSIAGQQMAIGTFTYRFPLVRNLNLNLFNWYLDKIYLGTFYQFGNAWENSGVKWEDFRSDVGLQLRLESYSWYMFPTRIFFEAAYPLEMVVFEEIRYEQKWKFYFGILFDFDIRFDKALRRLR